MLAQCARFESSGGEFADEGRERHAALKDYLEGDITLLDMLGEEDADAVRWAGDYIKLHAPMRDHPVRFETHVNPLGEDLQPIFENGGTADVICGPELFDFKWRPRDYTAQMAGYALDIFQSGNFEQVRVHLLFGAVKRPEVYKLDEPSARDLVMGILERVRSKPEPTPCDYCAWCSNKLTCSALTKRARFVATGYAEEPLLTQVANWHPSEMVKPDDIALGLLIWRKILKTWGESMEYHALKAATNGLDLPGFELKDSKGKSYILDTAEAHRLSGLPSELFLQACEPRMNTSKKYKEKLGLNNIYAAAKEMKLAPAKRELKAKLEPVIKVPNSKKKLVFVGGDGDEDETEE
jgi:hypothetical protein